MDNTMLNVLGRICGLSAEEKEILQATYEAALTEKPVELQSISAKVEKAITHWGHIETTTEGRAGDMHPTLACDDEDAKAVWVANGCNAFQRRPPISLPIAFWLPEDLAEYASQNHI